MVAVPGVSVHVAHNVRAHAVLIAIAVAQVWVLAGHRDGDKRKYKTVARRSH